MKEWIQSLDMFCIMLSYYIYYFRYGLMVIKTFLNKIQELHLIGYHRSQITTPQILLVLLTHMINFINHKISNGTD